jgi:hypothetical protein
LYQRMRNPPFLVLKTLLLVLKTLLRAQLKENFYHQGFAKYGV